MTVVKSLMSDLLSFCPIVGRFCRDAGCGFGDTAIKLARLVGPSGSVLAVDCCDAFLEFGRKDAKAAGISNITFLDEDVQTYPFEPVHDFAFRDLARSSSRTR